MIIYMKKGIVLLNFICVVLLAFSCTKIKYDLDGISGKWLVTSTTGQVVIRHDNAITVNDTVRFNNGVEAIFVSRPGQNSRYDDIYDIHYFDRFHGVINDDRLSFTVSNTTTGSHTFELIESRKNQLVLMFKDNGAIISLRKQE